MHGFVSPLKTENNTLAKLSWKKKKQSSLAYLSGNQLISFFFTKSLNSFIEM